MTISGVQKLTLLDFPGRTAATIFTPGCDFRCPFCHNASLVVDGESTLVSEEEIFDLLKKRQGVLSGLAITGGEPLMQADIDQFIGKVKEMGYAVKLDTNGSFPARLENLLKNKLVDYVAMDIKNSKAKYLATSGIPEGGNLLENIEKSIALLRTLAPDYEFRTTVVRELHTKEDIEEMGRWMAGNDKFFLQCFVDSGDILCPGLTAYSKKELEEMLAVFKKYVPKAELRGI